VEGCGKAGSGFVWRASMPKIAIINPSNKIGGAEKSLLEYLEKVPQAERSQYQVIIREEEGSLDQRVRNLGYPVHLLSMEFPYRRNLRKVPATVKRLEKIINRDVTVVYANRYTPSLLLALMKLKAGERLTTILHNRDVITPRIFLGNLLWIHDILIFNSNFVWKRSCPTMLKTRLRHRVQIIYNAVDVTKVQSGTRLETCRAPVKSQEQWQSDGVTIGMFGRFVAWKNYHYVLNILARNEQLSGMVNRVIVVGKGHLGDPKYEKWLETLVKSDKVLRSKVSFVCFTEDIWPLYKVCDIIVIPSTQEPFGRVAIEAGALGKAVLAARAGGLPEIIEDGQNGFTWNLDDEEEFIDKFTSLAANAALRRAMGMRLYSTVKEKFSSEVYYAKLHKLLMERSRAK